MPQNERIPIIKGIITRIRSHTHMCLCIVQYTHTHTHTVNTKAPLTRTYKSRGNGMEKKEYQEGNENTHKIIRTIKKSTPERKRNERAESSRAEQSRANRVIKRQTWNKSGQRTKKNYIKRKNAGHTFAYVWVCEFTVQELLHECVCLLEFACVCECARIVRVCCV